ncbi:APC family permease [Gordonia sp. NPDC003376]
MSTEIAPPSDSASPELVTGTISARQALFFGLTSVGISAVISGYGATIGFDGGYSSWLAMVLGAVVIMLLGTVVIRFSRRHLTTGSIMSYLNLEVGRPLGILAGAALFVGYIAVMVLFTFLSLVFLISFLNDVGLDVTNTVVETVIGIVIVATLVLISRRGVSVSVKAAVFLGWVSVPFVIVILVVAVMRFGIDAAPQIRFDGFGFDGFVAAFVLAFGGMAGFEGFTALAQETADPRRTIPRLILALVAILAVCSVASVFLTTPIMLAHSDSILGGASPLQVLADVAHLGALGTFTNLLMFLASVGSLLAYINDAGRIFGTAGRDGLLPAIVGRIHPVHRTPANAIVFVSATGLVVLALHLLISGDPIYTAFINFAVITSYAWAVAYVALAVAGVVDGVRTRSRWFVLGAILAGAGVTGALLQSIFSANRTTSLITVGLIAVLWTAGMITGRRIPAAESTETL